MRIKDDIKNLKPYFIDEKSVRFKLDANESPYDLPEELKEELLISLKNISLLLLFLSQPSALPHYILSYTALLILSATVWK